MNREQIVEAVANMEREIDAATDSGGIPELSNDSLRVYWRKCQYLREEAGRTDLPTTKIDQLQSHLEAHMSSVLLAEASDALPKERTAMEALHPARDEESRSPAPVEEGTSAGDSLPEPKPRKSEAEQKQSISELFGGGNR